jgi:hypothetical protein
MLGINDTSARAIEHNRRVANADQYGWLIDAASDDRRGTSFGVALTSLGALLARGHSERTGRTTRNGDAAVEACSRGPA